MWGGHHLLQRLLKWRLICTFVPKASSWIPSIWEAGLTVCCRNDEAVGKQWTLRKRGSIYQLRITLYMCQISPSSAKTLNINQAQKSNHCTYSYLSDYEAHQVMAYWNNSKFKAHSTFPFLWDTRSYSVEMSLLRFSRCWSINVTAINFLLSGDQRNTVCMFQKDSLTSAPG